MTAAWPITFADVLRARARLRLHLSPTPLRTYAPLDDVVGGGVRVLVKHENHNPTGAFKVRNGVSVLTALGAEARGRGVVAATRGNHGAGLAWAGRRLGVPVTVCVPVDNNPEKNEAMKGLGATLVERGRDYDEATAVADELVASQGLTLVHSTNNRDVVAGAATLTFEIFEDAPDVEAIVVGVGGGSQAVGAMTVARALNPSVRVFAVQAAGAPAIHDAWKAGVVKEGPSPETFADGLATRVPQPSTFHALHEGLAGFVTVSEGEMAESVRILLRTTHNLAEGAGAAPLAALFHLRDALRGQRVAIVLSGGNIDQATLRRVMNGEV